MNSSRFITTLSLAATLGFATGCTPSKDDKPPSPKVAAVVTPAGTLPKLGPAPAWKLQDLNGKPLAELKGKVVVLDFWATWCGPCRMEIPGYIEMTKKYGKDGLVIVGASVDQAGPEVVKAFADKMGINYPGRLRCGGSDSDDHHHRPRRTGPASQGRRGRALGIRAEGAVGAAREGVGASLVHCDRGVK
jgi:thiol-disulfide isomerase/thioredoxin